MSDILRRPQVRPLEKPPAPAARTMDAAVKPTQADEAQAMLARAKAEIQAMRTQAAAECAARREEAEKTGYADGLAKAQTEIEQWRAEAELRLSGLLEALGSARGAMQLEMEAMLRPLLLDALARVIGEMPPSAEQVEACVRNALKEAVGREPVTVRLHPDDAALLAQRASVLGEAGREVTVVADSSVAVGGCVLETAHGDIDAQLSTRLERLRAALLGTTQS